MKRYLCFECEINRRGKSSLALSLYLFVAGILLYLITPGFKLGTFYLGMFASIVLSIVMIVFHEAAHALIAALLGFKVFAIHLGMGKIIRVFKFLGISWYIRKIPTSGITLVSGPEMPFYRLRTFLFTLAGPGFHAAMIVLMQWLHFTYNFDGFGYNILLWTNIVILIWNLLPRKIMAATGAAVTDGALLLQIPRLPAEELHKRFAGYYLLETVAAVENGQFELAFDYAKHGTDLYPDVPNTLTALGYACIYTGAYLDSRQAFLKTLEITDDRVPVLGALAKNNLAFVNLLLDDPALLSEADTLSEQAYQVYPWEPAICGTRGGVLVAINRPDDGIKLLKTSFKKNHENRGRAIDACLIAWGEFKRGDLAKAQNYLALACRFDPGCIIFDRISALMDGNHADS